MNTSRYISFICSLLVMMASVNLANSQASTSSDDLASRGDHRMQNAFMKLASSLDESIYDISGVNGSKYFNEKFTIGKVYIGKEKQKEVIPARYNAYNDIIEIQNGDEIQGLVQAEDISCTINGELYVYTKYYTKKNKDKLGYLKILHRGDHYTLYKQEVVKFREAKPAKNSLTTSFPARFVKYENFFFKANDEATANEINKKSIPKSFTDNQAEIKEFMKKNDLNLKSENDLLKLFTHYNSL